MQMIAELLKPEFQVDADEDVVRLTVRALDGVDETAADVLAGLGVHSIHDLAHSALFRQLPDVPAARLALPPWPGRAAWPAPLASGGLEPHWSRASDSESTGLGAVQVSKLRRAFGLPDAGNLGDWRPFRSAQQIVAAATPAAPAVEVVVEQIISREDSAFNCQIAALTVGRDGLVYLVNPAPGTAYLLRVSRDGVARHGAHIVYAVQNAIANADGVIASANAHFNHSVNLYDAGFSWHAAVGDFLVSDAVGWDAPGWVEVGASGDFYGLDQHRDRILRISPAGTLLRSYPIPHVPDGNPGIASEFRACETNQAFYIRSRDNMLHCVGFDGTVRWALPTPSPGPFDVDDDGVLYVIGQLGPAITKYGADGTLAGEIALGWGDLAPGWGLHLTALRVHAGDVVVKRYHQTELFQVFDLSTGARKAVASIEYEKLTMTFPGYVWFTGQPVSLRLSFAPADIQPRWRVWATTFGTADWRELPFSNGQVQVPGDLAGLYHVKVTPEVQSWERGRASEYVVRAVVEVRRPGQAGTVNVLTPGNQVSYAGGEDIPITVIRRTGEANPPSTAVLSLRQAVAGAVPVWEETVTFSVDPAGRWTASSRIPAALSSRLRPGRYTISAAAEGYTAVPQQLVLGRAVFDTYRVAQHGDYGETYPAGSAWNAADAAMQHVARSGRLGVSLFVDRLGNGLQHGNLDLPNTADGIGLVREISDRLNGDPAGVAAEKADVPSALRQTLAAYGGAGIRQMAILTYMDAGLPIGTGYDTRTHEQFAQMITDLTQRLSMYPAFRGWDWTANWWVFDWDRVFQSPEEKQAYQEAMTRATQTGVWDPLLATVRDRAIGWHVEGQDFFNQTLRQVSTTLATANSGPYRNLTCYPPLAFAGVDEVDSHFQAEQISPPSWFAHGIDYQRRPGKPIWAHPEVWNDLGTGERILPAFCQLLMRNADGIGQSGPVPNWGNQLPDPRNGYDGIPSVFRAVYALARQYGVWLTTLTAHDQIGIIVSKRAVEIDQWATFGGRYFERLFEAYNSCLAAHRSARFIFPDDLSTTPLTQFAALLVVNQTVQLDPAISDALSQAQAAGVPVFADRTCRSELVTAFTPLSFGFDRCATIPAINNDHAYWTYPEAFAANAAALADALAPHAPPIAQVAQPGVLVSESRSGNARFIWAVNDTPIGIDPGHLWRVNLGVASRRPLTVPVVLPAQTHDTVYDVFAQAQIRPEGGQINADLRTLPARLYAILPQPIGHVTLMAPAMVRRGDVVNWTGSINGVHLSLPIRVQLLDVAGNLLEDRCLAAPDGHVSGGFTVPVNVGGDRLTLRFDELISGKTTHREIQIVDPLPAGTLASSAAPTLARPVDQLFGPHLRDVAVSADGSFAVLNAFNWDTNLYGIDLASGGVRWQQRVGHYFTFAPQPLPDAMVVQGYDLKSAPGYHLYLVRPDGTLERRFGLYAYPNRLPFWFIASMPKDRINNFAASPDGRWIAAAGDLGVAVWERDGTLLWRQEWWRTARRNIRIVALGTDTLLVVEGTKVTAHAASSGQVVWELLLAPVGETIQLAVSDDHSTCAVLTSTGSGRAFLLRGGQIAGVLPATGSDLRLSPTGDRVAVTHDNLVKVYNVASGLRWSFAGDDTLVGPRFSPDGTRLVVASRLGTVYVLDVHTGAALFERDLGALAVPAWLPGGDLLLATWMGEVHRLDGNYRPRWVTRLPAGTGMPTQPLADDLTPTVSVTASNAEAEPWPLTPNLLTPTTCLIRALAGDRQVELTHPPDALFDGLADPPAEPWLTWHTVQLFDSGWAGSASIIVDTFHRQLRVRALTFAEDPAHPESWLHDLQLEYWKPATEQWVRVGPLLSNAATHTHVLDAPIEAARFRFSAPPGAYGWPIGNLRLGEIVFHGEDLGCSHPDVIARSPVAVLFDEQESDLTCLQNAFNPAFTFGYTDAYSGGKRLELTSAATVAPLWQPPFGHAVPNWCFEIVENPQPGQYRYLRFAWKATSPATTGISVLLGRPWPSGGVAVTLGNATWPEGVVAEHRVDGAPPAEWTVVQVDLWDVTHGQPPTPIQCLLLKAVGGGAAFDQIVLTQTPTETPPIADLRVAEVGPEVNDVFSSTGTIEVDDLASPIAVPGATGDAFLQSRTFTGEPASPSGGLHGYEYRIALESLSAPLGTPCIVSLSLDFGPASVLDYTGISGDGYDAYVRTSGALGTVRPGAVRRSGQRLVVEFAPPGCVAAGEGTFFLGFASPYPPRNVTARLTDSAGAMYDLPARAPAIP
jgi:WD40 repeat protein